MVNFSKGRRYLCNKCGTLFLLDKPLKSGEEPECPMCHSKDISSEKGVVKK